MEGGENNSPVIKIAEYTFVGEQGGVVFERSSLQLKSLTGTAPVAHEK